MDLVWNGLSWNTDGLMIKSQDFWLHHVTVIIDGLLLQLLLGHLELILSVFEMLSCLDQVRHVDAREDTQVKVGQPT